MDPGLNGATPLLLRVIKPIIKKTVDTVKKKLGKTPYRPSRDEIKSNQYRQSKGLNPLNFEDEEEGLGVIVCV